MRFLEVAAAELRAGNVGGDGEHGHPGAVAIVETVDEVRVARPATARANGQRAGQMRLRSDGKCGDLFVAHGDPLHVVAAANGIGDAVQGGAHDGEDAFDARAGECFDE